MKFITYSALHDYVVIILCFILTSALYSFSQDRITYNDGLGWDGVQYYTVAKQLSQQHSISAAAPFVYRLGTPLLSTLSPSVDIAESFYAVNVLGNFVSTILLFFWLRIFIKKRIITVSLVILFLVTWLSPARFVHY